MKADGLDLEKGHSLHYLDMAFRTDKRKIVKNPDGYGRRTGACGDTVEIFLSIREGCIQSVSFDTDGCISTNACCNTLAYLVEGKTIAEAWNISPDDVVDYLKTLSPENVHCAELAAGALYQALANYNDIKKNPWKRWYQGN